MGCCACGGNCSNGAGCGCHTSPGQCCCSDNGCETDDYSGWRNDQQVGGCGNTDGSCPDDITGCDTCRKHNKIRYESCVTSNCACSSNTDCPDTNTSYTYYNSPGSCNGDPVSCPYDCLGIPNGDAVVDSCGVCNGGQLDPTNCSSCGGDEDSSPAGPSFIYYSPGCNGVCDSGLVDDLCGDCDGDNTTCCSGNGIKQPDGLCECISDGGNYENGYCGDTCNLHIDECGECNQINSSDQGCGCEGPSFQTYYQDTDGDGLGSGEPLTYCLYTSGTFTSNVMHYPPVPNNISNLSNFDPCPGGGINGYCLNNSDDYADCTSNDIDFCGKCDGDNNCNNCISIGNCTTESDYLGICSGTFSGTDFDCNGECYGTAFDDNCGECSGGESNHEADSDKDCNGDCFGGAESNDCGVCISGSSPNPSTINYGPEDNALQVYTVNNGEDCAGICGTSNSLDDCGWCIGSNTVPAVGSGFECYDNVNILGYTLATTGTGGPNGDGTDAQGQSVIPSLISSYCTMGWSKDAYGVCHGESIVDACGIPSGGNTGLIWNLCSQSMSGNRCHGYHSGPNMDNCGVCHLFCNEGVPIVDGGCDNWNNSCLDCAGIPNGNAFTDDCGRCICEATGGTCDDQEPNCKLESIVSQCSGLEGSGPNLDCNNTCYKIGRAHV